MTALLLLLFQELELAELELQLNTEVVQGKLELFGMVALFESHALTLFDCCVKFDVVVVKSGETANQVEAFYPIEKWIIGSPP